MTIPPAEDRREIRSKLAPVSGTGTGLHRNDGLLFAENMIPQVAPGSPGKGIDDVQRSLHHERTAGEPRQRFRGGLRRVRLPRGPVRAGVLL